MGYSAAQVFGVFTEVQSIECGSGTITMRYSAAHVFGVFSEVQPIEYGSALDWNKYEWNMV